MGWGSALGPGRLYTRERAGTHFTGGWVGHRAGLDGRKISSPPGFDPGIFQSVVSRGVHIKFEENAARRGTNFQASHHSDSFYETYIILPS